MKTDNIVSNESLEDAIYRYYPEEKEDYYTSGERIAFANGWKEKEKQLKPLLESHAELLEALNKICVRSATLDDGVNSAGNRQLSQIWIASKLAIEKANKLPNK